MSVVDSKGSLDLLNSETLKSLIDQGQVWGISIIEGSVKAQKDKIKNILNLGEIIYDDLLYEGDEDQDHYIPYGYEEDYEEPKRYFRRNIEITSFPVDILPEKSKITLKTFDILPNNHHSSRPFISFEGNDETISSIELVSGHSVKFHLKCTLPINYHGSLNRLLVMHFESTREINSFSKITANFAIGVLLVGSVVNKAAHHSLSPSSNSLKQLFGKSTRLSSMPKLLSTEAAPFIPLSEMLFFSSECSTYYDEQTLMDILVYPPVYISCVYQFLAYHQVDEKSTLYLQYIDNYRNNNLQEFAVHHGLNQLNEVLNDEIPLYGKPTAYLHSLSTLLHFEEMANQLDYYKYDIHFYPIKFQLYQDPHRHEYESHFSPTILLRCSIKIRGSSELRPKISVGNKIRIRPSQEDCENFNIQMTELIGIVLNYSLSSEEAVVIFSAPKYVVNPIINSSNEIENSSISESSPNLNQQSLQLWNSLKYHIRFVDDRTPYGFMQYILKHSLIENAYLQKCIFPTQTDIDRLKELKILAARQKNNNSKLRNIGNDSSKETKFNQQQEKAISEIVEWCSIHRYFTTYAFPMPPFIIFGPPGTGKTSTVIETILRVMKRFPEKRILACAPSDAAADVIALRLINSLKPNQLHRLNWWQRLLTSVPPSLLPYCNQSGNLFELHSMEQLQSFNVIVSTCQTVGALLAYSSLDLKFDVVIVDEASQATEMEVLLPLTLSKIGGVMVLAGDIHQLGPSTKFPLYRDCIPFLSLQERLLHLPFYSDCLPENFHGSSKTHPWSSQKAAISNSFLEESATTQIDLTGLQNPFISFQSSHLHHSHSRRDHLIDENKVVLGVFLNQNYRTHESILQISSDLFYNHQLIACAESSLINKLSTSSLLQAHPNSPKLFYDVKGKHDHEMDSPSFFNEEEVMKVVEICQLLAKEKLIPVKEIGVIAAFRRQVLKIRNALRSVGLSNVNVGGVEDFQGQEVTAVIISTVLTSAVPRFANSKGSFGLLNDAKRFNVSITRGMALCVVVGHRDFLLLDPYWKHFIKSCSPLGEVDEDMGMFDEEDMEAIAQMMHMAQTDEKSFDQTILDVMQQIFGVEYPEE